ncbi:hypothetical protein SASPL_113018 [Salvia splendens]|uniref:Cytochrome P450 n=1 Tax=Salvia splendens TaxID=180675 RepID=A0A8X8Y3U3_SALSN|nr:hypothetical protein SASPL_113018 [Salvia splendens]
MTDHAKEASKKLLYNCKDVGSAPYGEYWRKIKSIFVLQLLSNKRVQSFRWIREEETALLVNKVRQASGAVDLSAMFATFTNDGIARAAFGKKYSESENGNKFLRVMTDLMEFLGVINIGDFMPWLDWIGCLNGFYNRLDNTAKQMDDVLECLIQEHLDPNDQHSPDFVDILIQICHEDASIQRDSIKPLLLVI